MRFGDAGDAENDKDGGPVLPDIVEANDAHVVEQEQDANRDDDATHEDPMGSGVMVRVRGPARFAACPLRLAALPLVIKLIHDWIVAGEMAGLDWKSVSGGGLPAREQMAGCLPAGGRDVARWQRGM